MTLTELRYIIAVARERHFGRAADACFVSQPTLSVAVRKLEEELGVTLFERARQEVSVTPVGERIIEQAARVLEETERVRLLAQQGRDPLQGPLRVGAILTVGPYLLPGLVSLMHKRAPRMPLVLEENYTAKLSERLRQGELDVIIVALPFEMPGVVTETLYFEPFVVVLPASHPWCRRKAIDANDLATQNLLLLGAGHCFRDQVLDACPSCNRAALIDGEIQQTVEGSSLETIRYMVASGIGITVLPCSAVGKEQYARKLLAVRPFREPVPGRHVVVAWRESFPRPQAIATLKEAILDCRHPCVQACAPIP